MVGRPCREVGSAALLALVAMMLVVGSGCLLFEKPFGRTVGPEEICARLVESGGCDGGDPACVPVVCGGPQQCLSIESVGQSDSSFVGPVLADPASLVDLVGWCAGLDNAAIAYECNSDGGYCTPGDPENPCSEEWYLFVSCQVISQGPM